MNGPISTSWPKVLSINAYCGNSKAASATVPDDARRWPLRNGPPKIRTFLKPPKPVDLRDWRNSNVGWGIVAAETKGASEADMAAGNDLPAPMQSLRKDRGDAPILRYREGEQRFRLLRNYAEQIDVAIGQSPLGVARECIPYYLLICGSPDEVPWELQYILNAHYAVGRLHLSGPSLDNYVNALRSEWKASGADVRKTLVWAVNQGGDDITSLMRNLIAATIYSKLSHDADLSAGVGFIDGAPAATAAELASALSAAKPAVVVTTSHGQTYPLDNMEALANQLGLLVDQNYASVQANDLLRNWQPAGAVWYAHACCSAGASARTSFSGLKNEERK